MSQLQVTFGIREDWQFTMTVDYDVEFVEVDVT